MQGRVADVAQCGGLTAGIIQSFRGGARHARIDRGQRGGGGGEKK